MTVEGAERVHIRIQMTAKGAGRQHVPARGISRIQMTVEGAERVHIPASGISRIQMTVEGG